MKRQAGYVLFFFCIILCLNLFLPSSAHAQDFTINDFDVFIAINQDSSFTVKETLTVEFHRQRHGIYRDIPHIYIDSTGGTLKTPIDVISVTDSSRTNVSYRVTRQGNNIRVRIGDAKKYVSGIQKYEIFYKVENAILFFDDHDELYWNVTGNEWNAAIKRARCMVSLAGGKTKEYRASCYTGRQGSRESACRSIPGDNFIEFITQKPLQAGEGLTIAYGWDKGIISPPSSFRKFFWFMNLRQNWVFILPILSFMFMLFLWMQTGRDPRARESVTVMYSPPEYFKVPLTPAEVGALVDEKLDPRDITATIVGLTVKGYIKIEETKEEGIIFDNKDYYLKKVKDSDASLTMFERQVMLDIFGSMPGKMISELKNTFYKNIPSLKSSLYKELVRKKYFDSVGKPLTETNLYLYTGNNPINFIDPSGLAPEGPRNHSSTPSIPNGSQGKSCEDCPDSQCTVWCGCQLRVCACSENRCGKVRFLGVFTIDPLRTIVGLRVFSCNEFYGTMGGQPQL